MKKPGNCQALFLFIFTLLTDIPQYNCSLPVHPRFRYRSNEDDLGGDVFKNVELAPFPKHYISLNELILIIFPELIINKM